MDSHANNNNNKICLMPYCQYSYYIHYIHTVLYMHAFLGIWVCYLSRANYNILNLIRLNLVVLLAFCIYMVVLNVQ